MDMYWTCAGHVLRMIWRCVRHVLDMYRACNWHGSSMFWVSFLYAWHVCEPGMFSASAGHVLGTLRASVGHAPNKYFFESAYF